MYHKMQAALTIDGIVSMDACEFDGITAPAGAILLRGHGTLTADNMRFTDNQGVGIEQIALEATRRNVGLGLVLSTLRPILI
eukprot:SAG31_NODE_1913_length_6933_cov_9.849722_4_plen_82_part_00